MFFIIIINVSMQVY